MYTLVLNLSGGASGHLLRNTESFVRSRSASTSLDAALVKALSVELKSTSQRVLCRHALMKAAYIHQCINPKHVRNALQTDAGGTAERMMQRFRELVNHLTMDNELKQFIENADMRIVGQLMEIHDIPNCKTKTIEGLMNEMLQEVSSLMETSLNMHEFADKAEVKVKAATQDAKPASASSSAPQFLGIVCCYYFKFVELHLYSFSITKAGFAIKLIRG
jgi:hypothetical protein